MKAWSDNLYWKTDSSWYRKKESGDYELTEKAPERAKKSFQAYCTPRSAKKNPFIFDDRGGFMMEEEKLEEAEAFEERMSMPAGDVDLTEDEILDLIEKRLL